ncbi:hypothetical protein Tco_1232307, partial [Tanacetum coccineum]
MTEVMVVGGRGGEDDVVVRDAKVVVT